MKANFTHETVFSFEGPNLSLLGNEMDFRKLSEAILDLTDVTKPHTIDLMGLNFIQNIKVEMRIIFSSKKNSNQLGTFKNDKELIFELDATYWERLFKYFVLMSWKKRTYYLNAYEDCLNDLNLVQECNFICSSEF